MFTSADLTSLRQRRRDLAGLGANIKLLRSQWAGKSGFDPNQPRVPAGNPNGGQWTDRSGSVIRFAQASWPRRPTGEAGRFWPGASFAQQYRLNGTRLEADIAIGRVWVNEPTWRPRPSASQGGIDAQITANQAITREANARHWEHLVFGIGPGPYARDSLTARNTGHNFTAAERLELNRIGSETGCHTCGTRNPGAGRRNFFFDHQPPNSWMGHNSIGRDRIQYIFPHCATCSYRQGGYLRHNKLIE